ncbi:glutathione binding-like protein, partial [Rhizobiaceae sp. 2RAB30]
WLTFVATELHKSFGVFFKPTTTEDMKMINREHLARRLTFIDKSLDGRSFLTGETFTAADAYLWTILGWAKFTGFDLAAYPNVQRFIATVASRPAVQKSLRAEGLA